jgi:hypothetical protein
MIHAADRAQARIKLLLELDGQRPEPQHDVCNQFSALSIEPVSAVAVDAFHIIAWANQFTIGFFGLFFVCQHSRHVFDRHWCLFRMLNFSCGAVHLFEDFHGS